jgi:hypothetical protein
MGIDTSSLAMCQRLTKRGQLCGDIGTADP